MTNYGAGEHLWVQRPYGYEHHAVSVGHGMVVHFTKVLGPFNPKQDPSIIECTTVEDFAQGGEVRVRPHPDALPTNEILRRAYEKLGQSGWRLFSNNCEHFATWCITNRHDSEQVRRGVSAALKYTVVAGGTYLLFQQYMAATAKKAVAGGRPARPAASSVASRSKPRSKPRTIRARNGARQCKALTASGRRCRNWETLKNTGYCSVHE